MWRVHHHTAVPFFFLFLLKRGIETDSNELHVVYLFVCRLPLFLFISCTSVTADHHYNTDCHKSRKMTLRAPRDIRGGLSGSCQLPLDVKQYRRAGHVSWKWFRQRMKHEARMQFFCFFLVHRVLLWSQRSFFIFLLLLAEITVEIKPKCVVWQM